MPLVLRSAARSDVGLVRRDNQDSGYAGQNLLVVADGMGGHAGGDVASSIAVAALVGLDDDEGPDALARLAGAIRGAQDTIMDAVADDAALAGMGTTVTAILRSGDRLALAHIGDSRAYLLRGGELTQVTTDHTFVQLLVAEGRITAAEAENHPQRSVIMRVLGDVDAAVELDTSVRSAVAGDRWLLCSDGLSGPVSAETIAETMTGEADLGRCAGALVDLALRAGGPDNVTCVVADVVDEAGGRGSASSPDGRDGTGGSGRTGGPGPAASAVVGAAAVDHGRASSAHGSPAARAASLLARRDTQPLPAGGAPHREDGRGDGRGTGGDDGSAERSADGPAPGGRGRRAHGAPGARRARARRWLGATAVVVVLLAAGTVAVVTWLDRQYYVGTAQGRVAIYSGLPQDVGPVRLSRLVDVEDDMPVSALPPVYRERVDATIGAEDLADARRIVADLGTSARPAAAPAGPTPSPTSPTPSTVGSG